MREVQIATLRNNAAQMRLPPGEYAERKREYTRKYLAARPDYVRAHNKKMHVKDVKNLSDYYVKTVLGARALDIPDSLIAAKRVQLQIVRLLKEKANAKHG